MEIQVRPYRVVRVLVLCSGGRHEFVVKESATNATDSEIMCWTADDLKLDRKKLREAAEAQVKYFQENGKDVKETLWEIQTQRPGCTWVCTGRVKV